ncbi:MAG: hypothetical protein R6V01_02860 [Thermoplasmatota archaeon]
MTFDRPKDNREFCDEMLSKLERPLSFIGERRQNYIVFEGEWTNIKTLLKRAQEEPSFRSRSRGVLLGRLEEIKDELGHENLTKSEAEDLYEEGTAIRRLIHLMDRRSKDGEEDRHVDTKRWIRYGRSISP